MSTIGEIKAKIDMVDFVSEAGVKLHKAGRNYTVFFCPFHFFISPLRAKITL